MGDKRELMSGGKLKAIVPQSMEEAFRLATAVIASKLAPPDIRTPEQALVIIMAGLEIGMPPLQSLQRIALINGRTAVYGDAALALVRASGLLEGIEEWETPDGVAHCKAKRKGDRKFSERTFSDEDAKAANLLGKPGPWQQYKKRMKQMRARGFLLRDLFPDVLGGIYLSEELEGVELAPTDITPPAAPQPTVDIIPPSAPEPKMRPMKRVDKLTRSTKPYANKTEMPSPLVPGPEDGFDEEREAIGRQITETAQMDAEDQPELFPEDVEVPSAG